MNNQPLAIATLVFLAACQGGELPIPASENLEAGELRAASTEPANRYNGPMGNESECIRLRDPAAPVLMYDFEGKATGYRFDGAEWAIDKDTGVPICPNGTVRVQRYPPIQAGGKTFYFQRGASGSTATERGAIRHGHIWVYDLARRPAEVAPAAPNGRACASETATLYYNNPEGSAGPIPDRFWYKPPASDSDGAKWKTYGDPPQSQGTVHLGHYNYLLWNWLWTDRTGGGQVRVVLPKNELIRRCDVESLTSPAYGYDTAGRVVGVGEVRGVYGKVRNPDGTVVYGWFVHSWRYNGGAWSYLVASSPMP